jgi:hypothetical protein
MFGRGRRSGRRRINSFDPHEPFEQRYWRWGIGLIAAALVVYLALEVVGLDELRPSRPAPRKAAEAAVAPAPPADPRAQPRDQPFDKPPADLDEAGPPVREDPRSTPREAPRVKPPEDPRAQPRDEP